MEKSDLKIVLALTDLNMMELPANIPSTVSDKQQIFKDDCMYCFDTAENNSNGLDVCLTCYQSYSRGDLNHTKEHYEETKHSWYLNIVKKVKPSRVEPTEESDYERKQKVAKLEIKEEREEDVYDISHAVYNAETGKSYPIESLDEKFKAVIDRVLASTSSQRNDEIKAWEQEIYPCEHSIELQQFQNPSVDLSHCSQCNLAENLWICLHCGSIGCGREQFGSSLKGNSHALKHYEVSEHPIAVKLGSLSAQTADNCDAYCYKCNDEVKVPSLAQCLMTYNIDVSKAKKTEQGLTELNLDQNIKWDFSSDDGASGTSQPVFGKGLTGFQNLGNSCYLNSVLQALFSIDAYNSFFSKKGISKTTDPANDLTNQLHKVYDGLTSGRYSKPNVLKGDQFQLGIKPITFKTLIGKNHPEFQTQKQQDAFEFLLYILDKFDNEFGMSLNESFNFLLKSKVLCTSCHAVKISTEMVDNLSLSIRREKEKSSDSETYKRVTMLDSFQDFCDPETIEGYQCDNCKSTTKATKSSGFGSYPDVLIVNAKRIALDNWVPVKVEVPVEVPFTIDLTHFTAPKLQDGEKLIEEGSTSFVPNEETLVTLQSMGFSKDKCLWALYNTNNSGAEEAMSWILEHMDDPDTPFDPSASSTSSADPAQSQIQDLVSMGFAEKLAKKALVLSAGDVNSAVEWLFSNPDDNGDLEAPSTGGDSIKVQREALQERLASQQLSNPAIYKLKAAVCHKGPSPHTGHYVAFIRKSVDGEDKWLLYNDEKVVVCDNLDDVERTAYIYFFEKVYT